MNGLIFDIKRFAVHDGPGIRTTVFLKGCPLKCPWCHNPEGKDRAFRLLFFENRCIGKEKCRVTGCPGKDALFSMRGKTQKELSDSRFIGLCPTCAVQWDGKEISGIEIMDEVIRDRNFYEASCGGVTFSGGEPTYQMDFLIELLNSCREKGLHITLDTCGYFSEKDIEKLIPLVDLFLVDIKIMDDKVHREIIGADNGIILSNIKRLCSSRKGVALRFPLIPGYTDSNQNLKSIAGFVSGLPNKPELEILPYHQFARDKYRRLGLNYPLEKLNPPDERQIKNAVKIMESSRIKTGVCFERKDRAPQRSGRINNLLKRALAYRDSRKPWERALWFTRGFKENREDSIILRRAKALEKTLSNSSMKVYPGELIAGMQTREAYVHKGMDEQFSWVAGVRSPEIGLNLDSDKIPNTVKKELSWWHKNYPPYHKHYWQCLKPEARLAVEEGVFNVTGALVGHTIPDYQSVLKKGFAGILKEAEQKIKELKKKDCLTPEKKEFYEAVKVVCGAAANYGKRYFREALHLASIEKNKARKKELEEIARICQRVPALPARTFHQAVQSVWFTHFFEEEELIPGGGGAHSLGRIDQYLYPYYKKDVRKGVLTGNQALEIIESLWIKCFRSYDDQHTMLGGLRPDGEDGVNELTFICLEAMANIRTPRAVGVRIHSGSTDEYLKKIASVVKLGLGVPSIYNDDVIVPALIERGIDERDARDYAVTGCTELFIPGKSDFRTLTVNLNLSKCLELALNDGCSMISGRQTGPKTGAPDGFESFEDLLDAFYHQVSYFVKVACESQREGEKVMKEDIPLPMLSSLMQSCVKKGLDITAGGAKYNFVGASMVEVATTSDSLVAIKKIVFEEKKINLSEIVNILKNNYEGHEDLRQSLIWRYPKFGNDVPEVDKIAADIVSKFNECLQREQNARGGTFIPLVFSVPSSQLYHFGAKTAATPDGRKNKEILAVSLQPVGGADRKGITALFNSQGSLPLKLVAGGVSNNTDLHPTVFWGEDGEIIVNILKGWVKTGGMEVALGVVSEEILCRALANPEKYRSLVVRVFGYSDYFVNLSREIQDYVIKRAKRGER